MMNWFKRNRPHPVEQVDETDATRQSTQNMDEGIEKQRFFGRIKEGLIKTRHQLGESVGRLLLGKKVIDPQLLEELEDVLLHADVGMDTTQWLTEKLQEGLVRKELTNGDALFRALKKHLLAMLGENRSPLEAACSNHKPFVILMVGVNGAGKTTTIGKLAYQYQRLGKRVMLAAGDTFRAAAVEQLQLWGQRNHVPVIAQHTGADSASVIFDAYQAAKARDIDILIADTAGRLHTQHHLMDELKKIKRVLQKNDVDAPHEIMLVLDASIGQNALNQARIFHQAVGVTGITMTKLDGTAKGGILFALAHQLEIPFRYVGVGEGIDDLRPFDPSQFIHAIFNHDTI